MISSCKMTPWMLAICCLVTADCLNVTDQQTSESQHEQVAILKQLRKVNDDGSYTFGYEAGDGSYKVETRDVLGNVKGTFGFVDANGEIKRVTYSSSNGTGFKATTVSPLQERISVVQSIPRSNYSSGIRRSTVSTPYATSTELSSSTSSSLSTSTTPIPKLTVVQSIPRNRVKTSTTAASTSTSTTIEPPTKSIFGHYIKTSKYRPRFIINGQQRPTDVSVDQESNDEQYSQITRPTIEFKTLSPRKISLTRRPIDHTLRPITDEFEEKNPIQKSRHMGNSLRRQLQEERTIKVEESSESNGDENSDVYAGSLSTTRPLFTTSSAPKIMQRMRTERPKIFHQQLTTSNEENINSATFDSAKYESSRGYEVDSSVAPEEHQTSGQYILRAGVVSPRISQREYLIRQSDQPIYIRQQPEHIFRDLSSAILTRATPIDDEENTTYSTSSPLDKILTRQTSRSRQPIYTSAIDHDNMDYITDAHPNDPIEPEESSQPLLSPHRTYMQLRQQLHPVSYVQHEYGKLFRQNGLRTLQPINPRDYPEYPYRNIVLPPEAPNPIAPPISRRDFQILLRRLLVSQYGVRALSHPSTYLNDALYDQQSYPTYQSVYQISPPRHAMVYNDPALPITYGRVNRINNAGLSRIAMTNVNSYPNIQYQENYHDPIYTKRFYRQKLYDQDMNDGSDTNGDEIFPPPIREALLLRMLQLAINNERSVSMNISPFMSNRDNEIVTTTPMTAYRKSGPVRSVQIITDDKSDEKEQTVIRKKI